MDSGSFGHDEDSGKGYSNRGDSTSKGVPIISEGEWRVNPVCPAGIVGTITAVFIGCGSKRMKREEGGREGIFTSTCVVQVCLSHA